MGAFWGRSNQVIEVPDVRGLYLAGGAAHPGAGVPMVLMSGWIAANSLDEDAGGRGDAEVRQKQKLSSLR